MGQSLSTLVISFALPSMVLNACGAVDISSPSAANAADGTRPITEIGTRDLAPLGNDNSNFNGRTNNDNSNDDDNSNDGDDNHGGNENEDD